MANLNITFNNKTFSIDPASLADALASLEGHLAAMVDEPAEPEGTKAGLYKTGSNYTELITSWEDLVASGVVHIDGEPISSDDLSEKNEYGFYYSVAYSANADGGVMVVKFNEDGSVDIAMAGQQETLPAGTAGYSSLTIDMSAVNWGVGIVSANGLSIAFTDVGLTFVLGEPVVVYTNLDLNTDVNSSSDALDGDLVIPQDITDLGNFNVDEHVGNLAFTVCEKLTGVIIPASVVCISDAAFGDCTSLNSIIFEGTVEQWNALSKGSYWNENVPATYIQCIDGKVDMNGNIIPEEPEEERLEGDGAEFYTLAPTALSFRSTAPLNELQEVQINGVTVDPSNYTLEEGSTIVTFPIEYLKTLNVGNYEVAVASNSKTVKGDFSVKAPELNEHGFYYNQPYTAFVEYFQATTTLFIREDGTIDVIVLPDATETCTYTISGNNMVVTSQSMGELNCTFIDEGTGVYNTELATTFVLGDASIAADEDYIYIYNEELGGYEVSAIDKTKAEYGAIKTGINGIDTVAMVNHMFADNKVMTVAPEIPNSATSIGEWTFKFCTSLTSVTIPNSVTSIGDGVFAGCDSLTNINIPDGVTSIGESAFSSCDSLVSIEIPDSVTSIGDSAFYCCTNLTNIVIPNSVTSIAISAFEGCTSLTSITIPNSVASIGKQAFYRCYKLTSVVIGDSVTTIGNYAFSDCDGLTSVVIPDNVTTIGSSAFSDCDNLTSVTFEGTVEQWNSITKGENWNINVPATYVQCSDGQVPLV